ncbi:SusC/RagA family TonB-linked outer membrane protein [Flexithrix dorotheae]|uniref:SusC/RagA family TonB-linked outer membrane protein n=1 Tax=Flexithrix dorotheae TaxID=70993 RepID=UPI00036F22E4|nr:SusC/RagA family TonB-linked outer membrane protein [Flexithrix dorotheae]
MSKYTLLGLFIQAILCNLLLASNTLAQKSIEEIYVDLAFNNSDLKEVFDEIEANTKFKFHYKKDFVKSKKLYTAHFNNASLADVLRYISKEENLRFKRINRDISVKKTIIPNDISFEESYVYQQQMISGKVVSVEDGEPLPGVSILIKGTNNGTTTDFNGKYSLSAPENGVLQFSFIGFETLEVGIGNQSTLDITLKPDMEQLEEVVVVGYGTVKKSDLTGSVSSVKAKELAKSTVSSFDQGLSGRAAGVQVTQQTGQPGGATSIRIRGGNSINSSNEPLYVIDGFPYYNDNNASSSGAVSGAPALNVLATLNPGDIENIEILKDASATAIYGSRGANGVILITTKRGKSGKGKVNFETYYGTQEVIKTIPVLNARQYAEFRNMAFVDGRGQNGNGLPTYSDEEVAAMGEGTNWQDEIFRTAPIQNYQLTFNGGSDAVRYAISANYFKQDGVIINSDLERYSLRANLDADISKNLKIGNNLNLSYLSSNLARTGGGRSGTNSIQSPGAGNIVQDALFYNPVIPVRDENGEFTSDNNSDTKGDGGGNQANTPNGNPVAFATLATQKSSTVRILENLFAEYSILENLKFKVMVGADIISNKENSYLPSSIIQGRTAPNGAASIGNLQSISWLNENTLSYNTTLGTDHSFNALIGMTSQKYTSERLGASGRDFPTDVNQMYSLQSANIIDPSYSNYFDWSLLSYLFRINYGYKGKLLFTFSGRSDGSSKFGENNKFGFFPSAAIAYRIGDEEFFQGQSLMNDLKLRFSAGITGNQEIPPYQTISTLGINRYPYNNESPSIGYVPTQIGNPDIKWETTKQINLGFDVEFFSGRIALTGDIYYKKTDDLLLQVRLPFSSGFANSFNNIGAVENKGFELALNTVNFEGDFSWTSQFNISANRNKVLDFGEENERYIGSDYNLFKGQAVGLIRKGEPIGNFVGYINDGIIKNQTELDNAPKSGNDYIGSRRFVDLNGDNIINNEDRAVIGNALPDFIGGFNNSLKYKNFSLDFLFQFSVGNEIYNMTQLEHEFLNGRQNNSTTVLNRFIPGVNEDTDVARAGNPPYIYFRQSHSRWIEDGSYIRLKNLTLSYDLPVDNLDIKWLRSSRVYVSGQNLWLLSDYRGYDPEVNINPQSNTLIGFDYASYPSAKVYMIGLNFGF